MKVLNLYGGIGGNAYLWPSDWEVTMVDSHPDVCAQYAHNLPHNTVIQADAHEYLLEHHTEFDLIWSSPPCPTHSRMAKGTRHKRRRYPDMTLYQEIILLMHFFDGLYVVENVVPFYDVLIEPTTRIGRHLFWSNFPIDQMEVVPHFRNEGKSAMLGTANAQGRQAMLDWLGLPPMLKNIYFQGSNDPAKAIRNAVHPSLGLHVVKGILPC